MRNIGLALNILRVIGSFCETHINMLIDQEIRKHSGIVENIAEVKPDFNFILIYCKDLWKRMEKKMPSCPLRHYLILQMSVILFSSCKSDLCCFLWKQSRDGVIL